jgi:molybdopterin-binding protein
MNFFKGKIVKIIVGAIATAALISVGVPAPVATTAGNAIGDQAQEAMAD